MSTPESIVCKPTTWFLFRALVMFVMFGVFSVLFYKDGSVGYRKANETYYLYETFGTALKKFEEMSSPGSLTADEWKSYASAQTVKFPDDPSVLPSSLKLPMPWPAVLQDYEQVKSLQINKLWQGYSKIHELPLKPVEHAYDARKIHEQWVVFWICASLTAFAAFFLIRTLGRSISADGEGITTQSGKKVLYSDLRTLDLRKWETKGLAFLDYSGISGKGRIRVDGLTYGGFKAENDQPAERLMQRVRSRFSGEILEYATVSEEDSPVESDSEKA